VFLKKVILKAQLLVMDLSDDFPLIGKPLLVGWGIFHRLKYIFIKKIQELRGNLRYKTLKIDSDKRYWVNNDKINYFLVKKSVNKFPAILSGNWDKHKKKIIELNIYKALKQKYINGESWEKTDYYKKVLTELSKGLITPGYKDKKEFDQYLESLDNSYEQLKKVGNEDFININQWIEEIEDSPFYKEIIVNIGRNGELLLVKGQNLLLLTKILKFQQIPIRIRTRHKKWIKFKKDLEYLSRQGQLYQQIDHPDLQDFHFKYDDMRYNMIKKKLSISHGSLLDIGANLGYFCHKFEEEGFDCYAVEINPIYNYFLKKIKKAESKNFNIISDSIFSYNKNSDLVFEVGLALNVFHNLIIRKKTFSKLKKLLNRLKVKELYFAAHNYKKSKNVNAYRNFSPTEFNNFIIKNSSLNKAEYIGKTPNGRRLFKIT